MFTDESFGDSYLQGFYNLVEMSSYNSKCDIVDSSQIEDLCERLIVDIPDSTFLPCCRKFLCQLQQGTIAIVLIYNLRQQCLTSNNFRLRNNLFRNNWFLTC